MDKEIENKEVASELDINSLSRNYFNWAFEHPNKTNPTMTALFFFLVEVKSRLKCIKWFNITGKECIDAIGMRSYDTYRTNIECLIDNGFIEVIHRSRNRYTIDIVYIGQKGKYTYRQADTDETKPNKN